MEKTVSIPKHEYDELIRYKQIAVSKNKFNFDEVFAIGNGKLNAQEVKNMLREEW